MSALSLPSRGEDEYRAGEADTTDAVSSTDSRTTGESKGLEGPNCVAVESCSRITQRSRQCQAYLQQVLFGQRCAPVHLVACRGLVAKSQRIVNDPEIWIRNGLLWRKLEIVRSDGCHDGFPQVRPRSHLVARLERINDLEVWIREYVLQKLEIRSHDCCDRSPQADQGQWDPLRRLPTGMARPLRRCQMGMAKPLSQPKTRQELLCSRSSLQGREWGVSCSYPQRASNRF